MGRLKESAKYVQLLTNFRSAKKTYKKTDGGTKKRVRRKHYDSTFHNIQLPFTFLEFMGDKIEEQTVDEDKEDDANEDELERMVSSFQGTFAKKGLVRLNEEYLEVSYTVWNSLFDPLLDQIVAHCKMLLALPSMAQCKYLYLVGGFSASKHLQERMFAEFGIQSTYQIMIFTP